MFVAGLTGNYGMGKSAVLSMFRELGAITIDADLVIKILLLEKETPKKIKALLGAGVFDRKGNLDKKKVAEKIFKNKSLRLKLENLLHPLVFERINNLIRASKDGNKIFIVEATLIFERGHENRFDRMITVFTDEKTAIKRLGLHGITPKQAKQRLSCQLSIKTKIKKADFKINNSGTLEKTKAQVKAIYKKLSEEAKVKSFLSEGKVHEAGKLLGAPYSIEGRVIKGAGRGGKLLHTPTANIAFSGLSPKEGVYAVKVSLKDKVYKGVANIGNNPTFNAKNISYEVHLFDFSGNLLGKKLRVALIKRIRDEKKFPNVKALETQIKKDIKKANDILKRL
ncbi:MAG: dephospho-CoA kinase [Nitrospirae bacterium]|nr:dephospho-CoA kinase [Nitrospirota bacterium]